MTPQQTHTQEEWRYYRPKKLSTDEIQEGCLYLHPGDHEETRLCVVNEELRQGIGFTKSYSKSVSFFGSARLAETDPYYQQARELGRRIAQELQYVVVTGGGPGIMEAGPRGAMEAGGKTVGYTIKLPMEQTTTPYVTDEISFYYFFTRKVVLSYAAEAYVFFPGGYGTLDELFELITLAQTKKISPIPIILVGVEFWKPLDMFIKNSLLDTYATISPEDIDLYTMTDDLDQVLDIIKKAPLRDE